MTTSTATLTERAGVHVTEMMLRTREATAPIHDINRAMNVRRDVRVAYVAEVGQMSVVRIGDDGMRRWLDLMDVHELALVCALVEEAARTGATS